MSTLSKLRPIATPQAECCRPQSILLLGRFQSRALVLTGRESICLASCLQGSLMSMPPRWPAILASSDQLLLALWPVLLASRRSRTRGRPALSFSPNVSPRLVHRATRWLLWRSAVGADLHTRPYARASLYSMGSCSKIKMEW